MLAVTWKIAGARGSMAAARGRNDVGDRVCRCGGEVEVELGMRWDAREARRAVGGDIEGLKGYSKRVSGEEVGLKNRFIIVQV